MMKRGFSRGGRASRKNHTGGKSFLAVVTFLNLLLSLILALLNRREVIRAVRDNDEVRVLFTAKDKTKTE